MPAKAKHEGSWRKVQSWREIQRLLAFLSAGAEEISVSRSRRQWARLVRLHRVLRAALEGHLRLQERERALRRQVLALRRQRMRFEEQMRLLDEANRRANRAFEHELPGESREDQAHAWALALTTPAGLAADQGAFDQWLETERVRRDLRRLQLRVLRAPEVRLSGAPAWMKRAWPQVLRLPVRGCALCRRFFRVPRGQPNAHHCPTCKRMETPWRRRRLREAARKGQRLMFRRRIVPPKRQAKPRR
jgi:hypothetical protein